MGRFLIFTGILLIITAIIFMLATLDVFGNDISAQIIVPIACEPGDTIRTQNRLSFSNSGSGQTTDFFCVDNEGDEENVTDTVIIIILVGFGGLLGTGILMIFIGARMVVNRVTQSFTNTLFEQQNIGNVQTSSSTFDLRQNSSDFNQTQIPPQTQAQIQSVLSQVGDAFGNNDSLADKLRQLDEAKQQGLISQSEYEHTRQAILDSMDD